MKLDTGNFEDLLKKGEQFNHILEVYHAPPRGLRFQIGFAVPHKRHNAYFKMLQPYTVLTGEFHPSCLDVAFDAVYYIMRNDPSYSTWIYNSQRVIANSVNIHVPQGPLEEFLSKEARGHRRFRMQKAIEKKGCEGLMRMVKTEDDFTIAIAEIHPQQREHFFTACLRALEQEKAKMDRLREVGALRKKAEAAIKAIKTAGFPTAKVTRALGDAVRVGGIEKLPSLEELTQWYETVKDIPVHPYQVFESMQLPASRIERLPTTLHEKASEEYDPSIVTFRVTEPMRD